MYIDPNKIAEIAHGNTPLYRGFKGTNQIFSWALSDNQGINVGLNWRTFDAIDHLNIEKDHLSYGENFTLSGHKAICIKQIRAGQTSYDDLVKGATFRLYAPQGHAYVGLIAKNIPTTLTYESITYADFIVGYCVIANKYYEIVNGNMGAEFNGFNELLSVQVYGGYAHTRRGVSLTDNYESKVSITNSAYKEKVYLCALFTNSAFNRVGVNSFKYWTDVDAVI